MNPVLPHSNNRKHLLDMHSRFAAIMRALTILVLGPAWAMAAGRYDLANPPDGIAVECQAIKREVPYFMNRSVLEREEPVDLVVAGTARELEGSNHNQYEITVNKVLFGSCALKTVTVEHHQLIRESGIYGLARSL